jgi:hypothetical protein
MIDSGYFAEGMGRGPQEEIVPEAHPDEAVVFEEFFSASLRMPPNLVHADILLKFLAHPQCHRSIIKIHLGGFKFRRSLDH